MAEWTAAYINDLPDSAFACIDDAGRHYPHHDASGAVDLPHLRAALSRIGDTANAQCGKGHLQAHAKTAGVGEEGAAKATAIKATILDGDHLRLLALPYGGALPNPHYAKGMDLDREWFSPNTDFKPDWLDTRLVDWHHGEDGELRREVIGRATDLAFDDDGGWVRLWLERGKKSVERVRRLVEAGGQLFGSSETLARLVRKDAATGEILEWPYLRQTLTTSPVNHLSVVTGKAVLDGLEPSAIFWAELPAYLASGIPVGQQGVRVDSERVERLLDDALAPWTTAGGRS